VPRKLRFSVRCDLAIDVGFCALAEKCVV